jgi:D-2-hydroxyacid dehydrogenase (NADP+)
MKVMALKRRIHTAAEVEADPLVDEMVDSSQLNRVFAESDYILCALPLTAASRNMIGAEQFDAAKEGSIFINVGRGAVVDQDALVSALQKSGGGLKGAALDVFAVEPSPESCPLWDMLDNVLLSPHNMNQTATFMQESTEFFVNVQLPSFVRGLSLYNEVDRVAGY